MVSSRYFLYRLSGYRPELNIKTEIHHISILYHIILAFYRHFSGFFALGFRTVSNKIIVFDYFRADKPFSKSVCIIPAVWGAFIPLRKVHARTSFDRQ